MAFVQLMEYQTSRPDDVQRIHDEWKQATQGKRNARRLVMTRHHGDGNRFCEMVFSDSYEVFSDSYEEVMKNSQLPETQQSAQRLQEAADGDITFFDLDVVDEEEL